jgi:translation initiation factor 2 beta subunit (eIF-2beta)/eIF-5
MPVTTRSQARLLHNACNENHQVCMECSPALTREFGINTPVSSPPTVFSSHDTSFSSISSFHPVRLLSNSSTGDPIIPSLTTASTISTSELSLSKFQNLKFSNSINTATLRVDYSDTSIFHISDCNQISNMEADCKDVKMDSSLNASPQEQMQQLFASLSAHISDQTNLIQKQIQQNDMKLMLAQKKFKEEVQQELDAFRAMLVTKQDSSSPPVAGSSSPVGLISPPSPTIPVQVSSASNIPGSSNIDFQN